MDAVRLQETVECTLPLTQPVPAVTEEPPDALVVPRVARSWTLETPMVFWEGLWGEDLVLTEGLEPDGPRVCDVDSAELELANATLSLADNGTEMHALADDDVSSQGSCDHMALAITTTEPSKVVTHAPDVSNNQTPPDSGDELMAAFESFLGNSIFLKCTY